jgi:hypothetical protein
MKKTKMEGVQTEESKEKGEPNEAVGCTEMSVNN